MIDVPVSRYVSVAFPCYLVTLSARVPGTSTCDGFHTRNQQVQGDKAFVVIAFALLGRSVYVGRCVAPILHRKHMSLVGRTTPYEL